MFDGCRLRIRMASLRVCPHRSALSWSVRALGSHRNWSIAARGIMAFGGTLELPPIMLAEALNHCERVNVGVQQFLLTVKPDLLFLPVDVVSYCETWASKKSMVAWAKTIH